MPMAAELINNPYHVGARQQDASDGFYNDCLKDHTLVD
jgi:hypothetical protein